MREHNKPVDWSDENSVLEKHVAIYADPILVVRVVGVAPWRNEFDGVPTGADSVYTYKTTDDWKHYVIDEAQR